VNPSIVVTSAYHDANLSAVLCIIVVIGKSDNGPKFLTTTEESMIAVNSVSHYGNGFG
jgi:hypothetical protein